MHYRMKNPANTIDELTNILLEDVLNGCLYSVKKIC